MQPQTDFRPQLHGFDFNNHWDTDDNYRSFIKEKLLDAVPIVVKIIVTNPLFGGALLGALGAAYGVGEALLPGIFDTIVIPGIINEIVNEVDDNITDFIPDNYGACGGMAYASLDYYYYQWVIPKGIYVHPDNNAFNVPPEGELRDYIYTRLKDTYDAGGVLNKMLEWFIILKTLPSQIGGGGEEIQNRTKDEWMKLVSLLDQGKPQPLAILYDVNDIHQVVAYGYNGDPIIGHATINIYDNNAPNEERLIEFDFTQSEIHGILANVQDGPKRRDVKGFFCIEYIPKRPPVSWYLKQGLFAGPTLRQSVGANFYINGAVQNAFTFFQPFKNSPLAFQQIESIITPMISDALGYNMSKSLSNPSEENAFEAILLPFMTTISFSHSGSYNMFAKVLLSIRDMNTHNGLLDASSQSLSAIFFLPVVTDEVVNPLQLTTLASLIIAPYNPDAISCYYPCVEGSNITLIVTNNPFGNAHLRYDWSVLNMHTGDIHSQRFEVFDLPTANTVFTVNVVITNNDDGSQASGSINLTTYSEGEADRSTGACKLFQYLHHLIIPSILINPFGPDDKKFQNYLQQNIRQIAKDASQIVNLSKDWGKYSE